jgi:ribonuclease D
MYSYAMIDSDEKLSSLLESWATRNITSVAMDFEGEFNLHVYGEHLCLIQLFDGTSYYLVDPFALSRDALASLLENQSVQKVMFDCASDAALVRKQYGITLRNVHDVRVSAQLLGFNGNYSALVSRCLGTEQASGKKGNQTANWMKRPLGEKLVEYALSDVEHLFAIRAFLDRELAEAGLVQEDAKLQEHVALPKGPDRPGYEKLDGWRYLTKDQKTYLKWFFEARDMLARKTNLPAFRILDKRVLVTMAKQGCASPQEFRSLAHHKDRRIEDDLVALLVVVAEGARKESIQDS